MSSYTQQTVVEAPVRQVWELLSDPSRGPDWNEEVLAVTGAPTKIEKGSTFEVRGKGPLGLPGTTTYQVEALEDMHEIKMQCQRSGFYVHWRLTPAQDSTFTEIELGVERLPGLEARALGAMHTKSYLRRNADKTLDALRSAVSALRRS